MPPYAETRQYVARVTGAYGKTTHKLDEPFLVLATQNPLEMEGTYPLPEAQLDRFFFKLVVGYSTREELTTILNRTTRGEVIEPEYMPITQLKSQRPGSIAGRSSGRVRCMCPSTASSTCSKPM